VPNSLIFFFPYPMVFSASFRCPLCVYLAVLIPLVTSVLARTNSFVLEAFDVDILSSRRFLSPFS